MLPAWGKSLLAGKLLEVWETATPQTVLLFLHDVDGRTLSADPSMTALLASLPLACVCPQGGPCWWVDRPCPAFDPQRTPERYLLEEVVPFCRQRWPEAAVKIGLLGFGMGGQAALRLAFKYPAQFPAAAGLAPALDFYELYGQGTVLDEMYDSREQCRQDTALLHVHPLAPPPHIFFCIDPEDGFWYRGNDRLHEKLTALGIAHYADLSTRAGGHSWEYLRAQLPAALRFLHTGLQQERRRLL